MLNRARNLRCVIWCLLLLASRRSGGAETPLPLNTVFVILMENHNWDTIKGIVANCPYINNNLLPIASYCDQYYNPPGIHPSEPNYTWLEGGTNFGILDDLTSNRIPSASHLVTLLDLAGISWKSYQEDMGSNPLADQGNYRVRHNPMVLFNDVNGNTTYMTTHVRPYTELAG